VGFASRHEPIREMRGFRKPIAEGASQDQVASGGEIQEMAGTDI
jgi:hypothetical protein